MRIWRRTRGWRSVWLLTLLLLAGGSAVAAGKRYSLDPLHTRIEFDVDHLGFSRSGGRFGKFNGELEIFAEALEKSRVEVTVSVASLDLGDRAWNDKVLGAMFFDSARFPEMRFVSSRIEFGEQQQGRLYGQLTLHGQIRPATLAFRLNRHAVDKYTGRDTYGFSATGSIRRSEFGMDKLIPEVGDEIQLRIEVEAVKERAKRTHAPGRGP